MSGWIWVSVAFFRLWFLFWIMQSNPSHVLRLRHRNFFHPEKWRIITCITIEVIMSDFPWKLFVPLCILWQRVRGKGRRILAKVYARHCHEKRWYFPLQNGGKIVLSVFSLFLWDPGPIIVYPSQWNTDSTTESRPCWRFNELTIADGIKYLTNGDIELKGLATDC